MTAIFNIKRAAAAVFMIVVSTFVAAAQSPPHDIDMAPVWSSQDGRLYASSYVSDPFGIELWAYIAIAISKPWNPYDHSMIVCKPQIIQQRYDAAGG